MPAFFNNKTLDRNALSQKLSQPVDKREGYDFNLVLAILAFPPLPALTDAPNVNKTIGLNLAAICCAIMAWKNTKQQHTTSNHDLGPFANKLCLGIKNIRTYYLCPPNSVEDVASLQAAGQCISDNDMEIAFRYFLQDEHAFAYILGELLMVLYTLGFGLVSAQFCLPFIAMFPLVLYIASALAIFALFSYLAYAGAKGIPDCLANITSLWTDIKGLHLDQKCILAACLLTALAGSFLISLSVFYTVTTFFPVLLTALGISSAICSPVAILLCIGMFIASTIISMQFCWGLFANDYKQNFCKCYAKLCKISELEKGIVLAQVFITLIFAEFMAWMPIRGGFDMIKYFLRMFPDVIANVINISVFCLNILGQIPILLGNAIQLFNTYLSSLQQGAEISKKIASGEIKSADGWGSLVKISVNSSIKNMATMYGVSLSAP